MEWNKKEIEKIKLLSGVDKKEVKKVLRAVIDLIRLDGSGVYPFFTIEKGNVQPTKEFFKSTLTYNLHQDKKVILKNIKSKLLESGAAF